MAGRGLTRARKESGLVIPSEQMRKAETLIYTWLPECLERTMDLARGVMLQTEVEVNGKMEARVYAKEPNFLALVYLIDRAMGKVRVESSEIADRLDTARAMFIEQQIASGFIDAQVKDLNARGERALIEVEMYPRQFVTEEEQERQLRDIARAANKALMSLTPESFSLLVPGCEDPAASLERLRGAIGRDQAEIIHDVLSGGKEVADEEEE